MKFSISIESKSPIFAIRKVFSLDKDPISNFPNKQFGHYNEKGYRKISDLILELDK